MTVTNRRGHFRVGDRVRVDLGRRKLTGVIVEDRGAIGAQGRHLFQIEIPMNPFEPMGMELPEDEIEAIPPGVEVTRSIDKLQEIKVDGKPAVGVKVGAKDHKDIELYFDKASLLPVKTVRPTIDAETLKEATVEVIYSAIKEFDGIKWPTKMVVNQDGKKLMEVELTEFKKLDKLDPNEFARPK